MVGTARLPAGLLAAPVEAALVSDLLRTFQNAVLCPRLRRPGPDRAEKPGRRESGLRVCGGLMRSGLRPAHQLSVAALLPLPCQRILLVRKVVVLVVLEVVVAVEVGLGGGSLWGKRLGAVGWEKRQGGCRVSLRGSWKRVWLRGEDSR